MNNKIGKFLSLGLGLALILISALFKSELGNGFIIMLVLGLIFAVFGLMYLLLEKQQPKKDGQITLTDSDSDKPKPEYRRKGNVLSKPEWEFLQVLRDILDAQRYEVLTQIALISVVDKVTQTSYRNELFRIIDYCIVDKASYSPLLLIELNDASHNRADRVQRDQKVNEICQSANLPIISFVIGEIESVNTVKKAIAKSMLKR